MNLHKKAHMPWFMFFCFIFPAQSNSKRIMSLKNYVPTDLVNFGTIRVSAQIVPDLEKLLSAARKNQLELRAVSGYRSYAHQEKLFEQYVQKELKNNPKLTRAQAEKIANNYSARAGHSEHQLGTTVDILSSENNFQFDLTGNLKYIDWLEKNCRKFNFKISYPKKNKQYTYEPWHLRWYNPVHKNISKRR